jgi:FAD/FMN-containing dehydrogenase/Fe-S oxidoreductase
MSLAPLPVVDAPPPAAETVDAAALREALARAVGGEVRFDRLSRALYSTDASVYQIVPLGVVLPRSEDDIRATLRLCQQYRVPLTARGGGTSQAGQSIGPGVVLDCSKYFNDVLQINATEGWVRVRPGCVLDELNRQLQPHGLLFAPDISTANRATIGGMIANNSSGTHSLIHGLTIDHVLELRVLLADGSTADLRLLAPDALERLYREDHLQARAARLVRHLAAEHAGEIDRRFPKILRRVGGYNLDRFTGNSFNLAHLFVGSEGTLGIVLEAKLRLVPLPRAKALLIVQFADLLEALAATPAILAHRPAAVEVMDRTILDSTKLNAEASRLRDFVQGDPGAVLIIEFYGDQPAELPGRLDALETDLVGRGFGYHFTRATAADAQARIWKLRTLALGLSMAEKGDAKAISFVEDTAVAPERLRDYIAEFLEVVAAHGTRAGVYAHASVGCLHVRPVVNLKTLAGVRQFQAIADEVAELVLKYGGALSGEHGDGLVRSPFQEKMFGPVLYQAFRDIKRTLDPLHLLNPGKIVDAPPLTTSLRYGPAYPQMEVATTFDFSADGGVTGAAELCAGVGECRKLRSGVMCPSYRATREEQHSTRGRANTLRLALTGQLELRGLNDPLVFEALELCLECKACKSECPTNVDMARLKAEVLHQRAKKHGLSWRSRIFGRVDKWSRLGSLFAPVSNWLARGAVGRWLNDRLFGIDRRRLPPAFVRPTFVRRFVNAYGRSPAAGGPGVLLFPDTFTNFHEPDIGMAAAALLKQVGVGPLVVDVAGRRPGRGVRCCGRAMISNGLLDRAVRHARHNVELLYPLAAAGWRIAACEPSCVLTIKDDYPALLQGNFRRQAETVAAACLTFEEVLADRLDRLPLTAGPKRILVQAHCHQRSLVGMGALLQVLRALPGAEVVDLDAGCCGLAGSFGYEKEHYEVSRLVGEQRLFPALQQVEADALVVAPGMSCRLQIAHFTGRRALHTAEVLGGSPRPFVSPRPSVTHG